MKPTDEQPRSEAPTPVLAYFNPMEVTSLGHETEFEVSPPPVWGSMIATSLLLGLFVGILVIVGVLIAEGGIDWSEIQGLLAVILSIFGPLIVLLVGGVIRLARHGQEPIHVAVAEDELIVVFPQQWGATPRRWRREEIDYLDVTHWGVTFFSRPRYQLRIFLVTLHVETVIFLTPDPALPRQMELRLREALGIAEAAGPWG